VCNHGYIALVDEAQPPSTSDRLSGEAHGACGARDDATSPSGGQRLSGAVVVLTRQGITGWPTLAIALVPLAVLWRFKIPEPAVVAAAGALGLLIH
jgi:chromate transporter